MRIMSRFMKIVAIFLLLLWSDAGEAFAKGRFSRIGGRFVGEEVRYEVGFWVFPAVGAGLARFYDLDNGNYLLVNEGQAKG